MTIKIRLLLCIAFIISANILPAQTKFALTGQVKDAQTKKPMEFCTVTVLDTKDSLISGSVTDHNGYYSVMVLSGAYRTVLSYIGYINDTSEVVIVTENTFMGVFRLEPSEELLNEITVKAGSYDNLIDRDIQVVTNKLKAGASNTKDVLDKLDGVDIDRYNNSVKVDNDSKVIILVDGLEKDQEYIKNLSPERLKKIEVIRDPGGRYGLEGYSAVINVILKKDYQGTELFLTDRLMVDPDASETAFIFVQSNASATVNYSYNKVNFYAKYGRNRNNFNLPSFSTKEYGSGLRIENNPPAGNGMNTRVKELYNIYTIGADYYVNPKHTVSFESNLSRQPSGKNMTEVLYNNICSYNDTVLYGNTSVSGTGLENRSSYYSFFYIGKFDEKNTVNSNFTFSDYSNVYSNTYTESTPLQRNEYGDDNKNSASFYVEYDRTFSKKTGLQAGYGNSWEHLVNRYSTGETESTFDYNDVRHKLYSYFSWQPGKKFGVRLGGAGETSTPKTVERENCYFIFQPYADIKYNPSKIIDFRLKYRAASNYPNVEQTNPFTYTVDPQSVRTGNPNLRPELTHKVSLQMKILDNLLTIEPYYHFSENYITQTGVLNDEGIFEYGYDNGGNYLNYGFESHFTVPFGKTIFLQTDLNIFRSSIDYSGKTNNLKDWTMTEQLIYVHEKSGLVAGLQYQKNLFKFVTAQGYNKWDNDFWITFIQRPFFDKKLSVMLLYFIPVNWGTDYEQGSYIQTDHYTENRINDIGFLKNMIMLEVSYRFNKGKTVQKIEKTVRQKKEKTARGYL
ncbi:MAG: outer membrane beta-barrel protein [Bacteroidetes bacterium]|nr:outer membrane beta-barrel protein [Bacteroidota bacterium]